MISVILKKKPINIDKTMAMAKTGLLIPHKDSCFFFYELLHECGTNLKEA